MAKEASDRTRSALYVFLIVNFGLFITVFGSNVYDRSTERLKDFEEAAFCDLQAKSQEHYGTLDCATAKADATELGYHVDDKKSAAVVAKRLESLVADELSSKKMQVPVIGFAFDIDYIWILTCYFGPLAMIIVLAAIGNEARIISEILQIVPALSLQQAVMLSSTQVLVARTSKALSGLQRLVSAAVNLGQSGFLRSIFLLPIFSQLIILTYDFQLGETARCVWDPSVSCSGFVDTLTDSGLRPVVGIAQFLSETVSLILMILLAIRFLHATKKLKEGYGAVYAVIDKPGDGFPIGSLAEAEQAPSKSAPQTTAATKD